ncbi:MAG: HD domain-containing protein [Lachnospiraceae bacterium]|nr:HD domain-containing protein [Lachnospiraceae bacterium]
MEYIHSKDIFRLMRDTLKMADSRVMDHGSRVAYYLFKMLEHRGGYEKFELADLVCLASLHDIGAYKTNNTKDLVGYEYKDPMPHSTYGYLIFKHLSPIPEYASVILYHHTNYSKLAMLPFEHKEIAEFLNYAEKVDIFSQAMKDSFNMNMLQKQVGKVLAPRAHSLFEETVKDEDILNKVKSGAYLAELEEIIDYMIFTNEDKRKFLEMLMFCQGFRSEKSVLDTVTCMSIVEMLGNKMNLSEEEMEQLYYGSLLHDIGMLAIPREIIEAPRKLTDEEYDKVKTHVHLAEVVLTDHMAAGVVNLVAAHHERCDGSGYPRGLRGTQMTRDQEILQLADTITALLGNRAYRAAPMTEEEIVALIRAEAAGGKYNKTAANVFLKNYDEIIKKVKTRTDEILVTYRKLNQQYKQVSGKFKEQ